jgi:hypothetical protein
MTKLVWPSIGLYCLFSIFVFYQQLHAKNFGGASEAFGLALAASAFAGTITGLVYIGYYGWNISWWVAGAVLLLGIVAGVAGLAVERLTGPFALSLGGFIGWPVCGYFMFKSLPSGA